MTKHPSRAGTINSFLLMHVLLPLMAGIAVYLFLRSETTIAEVFLQWKYVPATVPQGATVYGAFIGSFPDFCWLYALLSSQVLIWHPKKIPTVLLLLLYIAPVTTELLQSLHVIRGTGDWFDVIAYLLAIVIFNLKYTNQK